ncbi:hypothetical protein DF113_33495 [Burkholderia stagnalis]|uniref:hypothetical protein n=1 Tax=Burkholderia stagnalis TaxID=1503054 RepID=UPI000F5F3FCE|nr:hypothetical protein [Burkholderia stagnalis]RQY30731.1 hypothetical protein DF113_33495 [Burkholderia stagnalis]
MNTTDQQAIEEAVEQIGLSMAANAFPLFYVAQNIYDTSESILNVWNARSSADEMARVETGIDLVFAVVGWVPVVGAGVKRTFRLVNHKSEIYGPLLFDILRLVLQRAHCPTSPEELVDKLFDASGLKKLLTESREHIEKSWVYREMPPAGQATFSQALAFVEVNLPFWLTQFVERKLMHWRKKQPNSSAEGSVALRKETEKPGKVGVEAEQGHNRSTSAPSTGVVNAKLAVTEITNSITGLLGEHITDYYCYEKLKWGSGWEAHDQGYLGRWSREPGADVPGKLNDHGKLAKLFAPKAKGQGIDGAWRATPSNNEGKRFAIVEAKSSKVDQPTKAPNGKRNMTPKLGTAERVVDAVRPHGDELLEPPVPVETPGAISSTPVSGGKVKGSRAPVKSGGAAPTTPPAAPSGPPAKRATPKIVQMSTDWITQNLKDAVGSRLQMEILEHGYSRHIVYVPFYLPCAAAHEVALLAGKEHDHGDHDVPLTHHYREAEVEEAVKRKEARLAKARQVTE